MPSTRSGEFVLAVLAGVLLLLSLYPGLGLSRGARGVLAVAALALFIALLLATLRSRSD